MGNLMNPHELMAATATVSAVKLLGVKTSFARLARYMAAIGAEGTYNGRDIYEVMQGVCDMASAALGFLVSPEEESGMRGLGMLKDDEEFEKMVSELEEGGHA